MVNNKFLFRSYRSILLLILAVMMVFVLSVRVRITRSANDAQAVNRPNIIFIMADDMGYGDIRAYNTDSKIPTPNLDLMASQGVRFTDAHSPSAVCTPTRYGVLTGRYAWRTRLQQAVLDIRSAPLISEGEFTLPRFLKANGYSTAMMGKWHLGLEWATQPGASYTKYQLSEANTDYTNPKPIQYGPNEVGFDYYYHRAVKGPYAHMKNSQFMGSLPTVAGAPPSGWAFNNVAMMQPGFTYEQAIPMIQSEAVGFINNHASSGATNPFFMYVPLTTPHTPYVANTAFQGSSQAGGYGDMVVELDALVGNIINAVDSNGFGSNTLIIFTSDNGSPGRATENANAQTIVAATGHEPNKPLRGWKSDIYEGGHRIPYIARWVGTVPANSVSNHVINLVDLTATASDIINVPVPDYAAPDSFSFLPVLQNPSVTTFARPPIVSHSMYGWFSLRNGAWKSVFGVNGGGGWASPRGTVMPQGPGQLYNLASDLQENADSYNANPTIANAHLAMLNEIKTQGRSVPLIDSDNDSHSDWAELQAGTNLQSASSYPILQQIALPISDTQVVGINGSSINAGELGDWDPSGLPATSVSPLYVRERAPTSSNQQQRSRLFVKFDLSSLPSGKLVSASLRLHQNHRLNSTVANRFKTQIAVSRITSSWDDASGSLPLFDDTITADEIILGSIADFGTIPTASGYYSGLHLIPGDQSGADITPIANNWFSGAANYGLRIRIDDQNDRGASFSAIDDISTTQDESPALIVTIALTDSDGDNMPDSWEVANGLNPNDPSDGQLNNDGDCYTNRTEFEFGTNPNIQDSCKQIFLPFISK